MKREAEKVEHTTHRQAAAPVCELGSNPNSALEEAGIEFIERTKTKGPGVRLKE